MTIITQVHKDFLEHCAGWNRISWKGGGHAHHYLVPPGCSMGYFCKNYSSGGHDERCQVVNEDLYAVSLCGCSYVPMGAFGFESNRYRGYIVEVLASMGKLVIESAKAPEGYFGWFDCCLVVDGKVYGETGRLSETLITLGLQAVGKLEPRMET